MGALGEGMNPFPFIAASYGVGATVIVGLFLWNLMERRSLRQMIALLDENRTKR